MAETIGSASCKLPKVLVGAAICSIMGLALLSSVGCTFAGSTNGENGASNENGTGVLQKIAGVQNAEDPDGQAEPSGKTTLVETPYYTLEIPEDSLENGWTTSFDDSLIGDEASGIGGRRLEVYTPSSGDDPYFTVLQYAGEWFGLQHDQGYASTSEAFSTEVDGVIWKTVVMGGPYGDYGPMTLDESLAFTQYWAQHVLPPA